VRLDNLISIDRPGAKAAIPLGDDAFHAALALLTDGPDRFRPRSESAAKKPRCRRARLVLQIVSGNSRRSSPTSARQAQSWTSRRACGECRGLKFSRHQRRIELSVNHKPTATVFQPSLGEAGKRPSSVVPLLGDNGPACRPRPPSADGRLLHSSRLGAQRRSANQTFAISESCVHMTLIEVDERAGDNPMRLFGLTRASVAHGTS
jgi:hypothetical protein